MSTTDVVTSVKAPQEPGPCHHLFLPLPNQWAVLLLKVQCFISLGPRVGVMGCRALSQLTRDMNMVADEEKKYSQVLSTSILGVCYRSKTGTILTQARIHRDPLSLHPPFLPANTSIEVSRIVPSVWDSYHLHRKQHSPPCGSLVQEWVGTLGTVTVTPVV